MFFLNRCGMGMKWFVERMWNICIRDRNDNDGSKPMRAATSRNIFLWEMGMIPNCFFFKQKCSVLANFEQTSRIIYIFRDVFLSVSNKKQQLESQNRHKKECDRHLFVWQIPQWMGPCALTHTYRQYEYISLF